MGAARRGPPRKSSSDQLAECERILQRWAADGREISSTTLARQADGRRVINISSALKRQGVLVGKQSALKLLLQELQMGQFLVQRHQRHDYDQIIRELAERAQRGESCSEKALRADSHEIWLKRHQALRKYETWRKVVRDVLSRYPELRPSQFYDQLRLEVWPVELGAPLETWGARPRTAGEREKYIVLALRYYWIRHGRDAKLLSFTQVSQDEDGAKLHSMISELQRRGQIAATYGELVERATGTPYQDIAAARSGAKTYRAFGHSEHIAWKTGVCEGHPLLQSFSEAAVDGVLSMVMGQGWPARHSHGVPLSTLVPNGPVKYSVDIALLGGQRRLLGVVEVGAGALADDEEYRSRRDTKRHVLGEAGIPLHECDLKWGKKSLAEIQQCVDWVCGRLRIRRAGAGQVAEALRRLPAGKGVVAFDLDELREWLRQHPEIQRMSEYEAARLELLARGDLEALHLVPLGTLTARVRRAGLSWYDMTGRRPTGTASGRARAKSPDFAFYADYEEARARARELNFSGHRDYARRREELDPRLPGEPNRRWPEEFARDGWPGYLGTGASSEDLVGLVPEDAARKPLHIGQKRWKALMADVEPAATRQGPRGRYRYHRPDDLVRALVDRGELSSRQRRAAVESLRQLAKQCED